MQITTPSGSYPILVEAGALAQLADRLRAAGIQGALWLICDAAVEQRYALPLVQQLEQAGYRVAWYAVPAGEASKDLQVAMQIYSWLIAGGIERRDALLALGGGMVGDLAGFVAATILRGVAFVQLPTTLLAMVDSSLGGKTGVNHPLGKNLIGAFHQPRMVLSDTNLLASLPLRELRSGWAEVIKHGVIRDAGLFEQLEAFAALGAAESRYSTELIRRAAQVKVEIVTIDERETAERMLLNYGHTLGHAVEAAAGYGGMLHGEAIAIGMHLEAILAMRLGMVDQAFVARQARLIQAFGLPIELPTDVSIEQILALTTRDKKVSAGKIRWILPTRVGEAVVRTDVPELLVQSVLSERFEF
jgi:3-dehydroquinate synthase